MKNNPTMPNIQHASKHLKIQSLCNEKNAFQKYKKGRLFDESKISPIEMIREGKR